MGTLGRKGLKRRFMLAFCLLQVTGCAAPKPVSSFGHFGFDEALMKAIRKSEYTQPTPIQAQAVPVALSGRDIIGE